jgi:hypothetical protein
MFTLYLTCLRHLLVHTHFPLHPVNSGLTVFLNNWTRNYVDGAKVTTEEEFPRTRSRYPEVHNAPQPEKKILRININLAKQQDYM